MNKIFMVLGFLGFLVLLVSCETKQESAQEIMSMQPVYDSVKAAQYGADDYGMKKYIVAFLKRGPAFGVNPDSAEILQMAHLKNIMRMADEGKLVVAGPFLGNQSIRGIYIFNVSTISEAQKLTLTDPAIKAGILEMELLEWYGSAALIDVNRNHRIFEKKNILSTE
jgi:uncharacterized protein YciI